MTARNYYHRKGARGIPLYIRIAAKVLAEPCTSREISDCLRINQVNTVTTMRRLRAAGVFFVRCWMQERERGQRNEVWTLEEREEPPEPVNHTSGEGYKTLKYRVWPFSQEIHCFSMIIRLLRDGATSHDIAEKTGLSRCTMQSMVRLMRQHDLTHISGWIRNINGGPTPIHSLGARYSGKQRDAPRPRPKGENPDLTRERRATRKTLTIQHAARYIAQVSEFR